MDQIKRPNESYSSDVSRPDGSVVFVGSPVLELMTRFAEKKAMGDGYFVVLSAPLS
jgi:hypothetical protein